VPVFTRLRQQPDTSPEVEPESPSPQQDARATLRTRFADWRERHPVPVRVVRWTVTILAAVLVLGALVLPNKESALHAGRFVRIPVEAVLGAAVALVLPRRPRIIVAVVSGAALGALTILNLLDMGFWEYLGRHFNLVLDWELLPDAQSYVQDSMGRAVAIGATVGAFAAVPSTFVPVLVTVAVLAGAARGLLTLIQATAVTDRWGGSHYGRLTSRLTGPALLATAVAPWAGSALAAGAGGYAMLFVVLAVLAGTAAVIAVWE
jgi:hypothetical protein